MLRRKKTPLPDRQEATPRKKGFFRIVGNGIITGAADDGPSAIGTYASAGAKFGFAFLWVAPVLLPMMYLVVYLSAKLGRLRERADRNHSRQVPESDPVSGDMQRCSQQHPAPSLEYPSTRSRRTGLLTKDVRNHRGKQSFTLRKAILVRTDRSAMLAHT